MYREIIYAFFIMVNTPPYRSENVLEISSEYLNRVGRQGILYNHILLSVTRTVVILLVGFCRSLDYFIDLFINFHALE